MDPEEPVSKEGSQEPAERKRRSRWGKETEAGLKVLQGSDDAEALPLSGDDGDGEPAQKKPRKSRWSDEPAQQLVPGVVLPPSLAHLVDTNPESLELQRQLGNVSARAGWRDRSPCTIALAPRPPPCAPGPRPLARPATPADAPRPAPGTPPPAVGACQPPPGDRGPPCPSSGAPRSLLLRVVGPPLQINQKLQQAKDGKWVDDTPLGDRSPSPEPVYNDLGARINTRDHRAKDKLLRQRNVSGRASEGAPTKHAQPGSCRPPPAGSCTPPGRQQQQQPTCARPCTCRS